MGERGEEGKGQEEEEVQEEEEGQEEGKREEEEEGQEGGRSEQGRGNGVLCEHVYFLTRPERWESARATYRAPRWMKQNNVEKQAALTAERVSDVPKQPTHPSEHNQGDQSYYYNFYSSSEDEWRCMKLAMSGVLLRVEEMYEGIQKKWHFLNYLNML